MLDVSNKIIEKYMVRKSFKQKSDFLSFLEVELKSRGYNCYVDNKKYLANNRNLVVGDVDEAETLCIAHYDTCATMPIPNFITPNNPFVSLLYQLLIVSLIIGTGRLVSEPVFILTSNEFWSMLVAYIVTTGLLFMMMFGFANKNNYNDNTSGIITLLETMSKLDEDGRKKVAFVFMDNEEKGLLGSMAFYSKHHKNIKGKLVINFDCVSDGDNIYVLFNSESKKDGVLMNKFEQAFVVGEEKKLVSSTKGFYPSDQISFVGHRTITIAALQNSRIFGFYIDKLHTKRDIVFDESNIELISDSIIRYVNSKI